MTGFEIAATVSGIVNAIGIIAGLFGWKRHTEVKEAARRIEDVADAVITGVESGTALLKSDDAKKVKESIQKIAVQTGAESALHKILVKFGFSE